VTINNVAPSLGALTVPTGQLPIADPVSISANFSDAGTHDTHVVTVAWGDTQSETFTPGETNGAGTISRSHIYAVYGVYTITVTITDDDGGVAVRTATVNGNGPPTVSAGGPYTGTEGTAKGLTGTATDPEGDTLYPTWTITPTSQDVGTTCTTTGTSSLTPTVKCDDDAVLHAHLSVTDNINTGITDDTNITIQNVAPVVDSASALPAFIPTGGTINVSGAFHDAATNDTHTVSVNWGDATLTNAGVTETLGAGTFADAHVYTHSGFYTITVTVKDDNGGTAVRTFPVTVNTPPTVDAGGPYVGFEGSPMVMTANAHDVDGTR
jgi:hypothetical protein